jgi:hypothetical protein
MMIALNHALTGTAIAIAVKQPVLAIPLAFLSHFVLDAIPHFGDMPFYSYGHPLFRYVMAADGLLTVSSVGALMLFNPNLALVIGLGAFFAILPDVFWLGHYALKWKHWFFTFHQKIQWFERPPGIIVEAAYLVFISTVIAALLGR